MSFLAFYAALGGLSGASVLFVALKDGIPHGPAIACGVIAAVCWPIVVVTALVARLAR